ncbi:MAG: hypothetical protein ACLS48_04540 [[Eubacterium] siraeum]
MRKSTFNCRQSVVLETGKISLSGKASDLINDASVKKAYLGE